MNLLSRLHDSCARHHLLCQFFVTRFVCVYFLCAQGRAPSVMTIVRRGTAPCMPFRTFGLLPPRLSVKCFGMTFQEAARRRGPRISTADCAVICQYVQYLNMIQPWIRYSVLSFHARHGRQHALAAMSGGQ